MNALRVPPRWSEYIPKKNRHSESVPRGHDDQSTTPSHATAGAPKWVAGGGELLEYDGNVSKSDVLLLFRGN